MPVFVLAHHARDSLEMQGGATFHFVTDGIHAALDAAQKTAGERDVRVGVPDLQAKPVLRRVAREVAGLDRAAEREAMRWIEAVKEFDSQGGAATS